MCNKTSHQILSSLEFLLLVSRSIISQVPLYQIEGNILEDVDARSKSCTGSSIHDSNETTGTAQRKLSGKLKGRAIRKETEEFVLEKCYHWHFFKLTFGFGCSVPKSKLKSCL